jgi:hypothetical protein
MDYVSERVVEGGTVEREFTLGEISGILWTPSSEPAPLILMGHPDGIRQMHPRLQAHGRGHRLRGARWRPTRTRASPHQEPS